MAANQYAEFGGNPYSGRNGDASPQGQFQEVSILCIRVVAWEHSKT